MNRTAIIKTDGFMTTETRSLADELLAEGHLDEARAVLRDEIARLSADDTDERLACLNLLAKVERAGKNFEGARVIHLESYPLVALTRHLELKLKFHNGLGITYEELGEYDRALLEYEAYRFYSEQADYREGLGRAENNIAIVYSQLKDYQAAHEHLQTSRQHFTDAVCLAEINLTEAQAYLAEEKPLEALAYATEAVQTFIQDGQTKLLRDALPTLIKAAADYQARG